MYKKKNVLLTIAFLLAGVAYAQTPAMKKVAESIATEQTNLEQLYRYLHEHPELSAQEEKTSARMAQELKQLGFDVVEKIGGYGLAGILKNGDGPVVLIRTDMDALPLEEKTGLAYASKARGINAAGQEVGIMHACGHDLHMSVFIGTARALVHARKHWHGTLVMVAQPSEENGFGAEKMFSNGLYEKIPYPDVALALHNHATLPAGSVGYNPGNFMASVDMMNITVHGQGGHGAAPHQTIDPVVLSAQMILAFQTIVSREINPLEPAVITVGSIHGGTVHNIISDEVKLQLTLRSYSPAVRKQIIASIENKAKHLALQAGLPETKLPEITINEPRVPATINDKDLTLKLVNVFQNTFGKDRVSEVPSAMVGEDFSWFALQQKKVPICMFWLGTAGEEALKTSQQTGKSLSSLHAATFAPTVNPTLQTGITAMSAAALSLLR
ncbi:amidohydrolase [Parachryseolinea silvisoli]|uniref:amidohydrolase n=1 Tax=Parachryseolinea silvisoli TaxID=2873601 RepID=UPI002265C0C9|nr:amidohydrolase [Parachryseolinea silvisoli]MCD9020091.1 amidohydrolase [Parachryseolinea silvisoli]